MPNILFFFCNQRQQKTKIQALKLKTLQSTGEARKERLKQLQNVCEAYQIKYNQNLFPHHLKATL